MVPWRHGVKDLVEGFAVEVAGAEMPMVPSVVRMWASRYLGLVFEMG